MKGMIKEHDFEKENIHFRVYVDLFFWHFNLYGYDLNLALKVVLKTAGTIFHLGM